MKRLTSARISATVVAVLGLLLGLLTAPSAQAEQAISPTYRVAAGSLAVGGHQTCAILTNGQLRCWGSNIDGVLGLGNTDHLGDDEAILSVPPINLGPGRTATAVTVGDSHTCALLDNGQLRCWGNGSDGKLGLGNTDDLGDTGPITAQPPINLGPGRTAVAVSAGGYHTCAILDNGQLRCWGDNSDGQLGLGTTDDLGDTGPITAQPPINLGPGRTAVAVSAGQYHTCAILDNGRLRCWGDNGSGQLGLGINITLGDDEAITSRPPIDLGPGRTAVAVTASSGAHTCAILDNAQLRCWGDNFFGQLGLGTATMLGKNEPITTQPPVPIGAVRAVSAGNGHTCATLATGAVRCWGQGGNGRLGLGNTDNVGHDAPVTAVPPINLGRPSRVAVAGGGHSCAVLDTGQLRCWGHNHRGQLGLGTTVDLGDNEAVTSVAPIALGSTVRTRAATQLTAKAKPQRSRKKPYRYRITGQARGTFIADTATCAGTVRATTKGKVKARLRGQARVRKIRVTGKARTTLRRVGNACTYRMRVTVKPAKKKQARRVVGKLRGKPRVILRKPATTNLNPATKRLRVRLG